MTAPPREGLIYRGMWLWMWPDWTLSLFANGFNTSRINPLDRSTAPSSSTTTTSPSRSRSTRTERTVAGSIEIVRQDFEVCLHTNRNYRSRAYTPGRCHRVHEQGVAYFQRRLAESRET